MIEVLSPGAYTTVQDGGRRGYMRFGVSRCGAMDALSLACANLLVGSARCDAALEATLTTPSLRFLEDTVFAITGGICAPTLDGEPVPMNAAVLAHAGQTLTSAPVTLGCRTYIAFAGGIDVKAALGSRSCDKKAEIGGLGKGQKLIHGDVLPNHAPAYAAALAGRRLSEGINPHIGGDVVTLRLMRAVQAAALSDSGWETLVSTEYTVLPESDRMGTRFNGKKLDFAPGFDGNIITDALTPGAVQIPPSGLPILMNADAQTTGGYAKPAWVIAADMAKAAQLRPGTRVRFSLCGEEEAVNALRAQRDALDAVENAWRTRAYRVTQGSNTYEISVTEVFPY